MGKERYPFMYKLLWSRPNTVLMSIVYVVLGIVLILFPGLSLRVICTGLGILSLVYALLRIWRYVKARREDVFLPGELVVGILLALLGAICLLFPSIVVSILPATLGFLLLLEGISKLPSTWEAVKGKLPNMWIFVVMNAIPLVLGAILFFNPFSVVETVVLFFGICLVVEGVCDLIAALYSKSSASSGDSL